VEGAAPAFAGATAGQAVSADPSVVAGRVEAGMKAGRVNAPGDSGDSAPPSEKGRVPRRSERTTAGCALPPGRRENALAVAWAPG
jgi:hypothetical protein